MTPPTSRAALKRPRSDSNEGREAPQPETHSVRSRKRARTGGFFGRIRNFFSGFWTPASAPVGSPPLPSEPKLQPAQQPPVQSHMLTQQRAVFIKTYTGKVLQIDVQERDTFGTLKRRIFEREGIPPDEQLLMYGARALGDEETFVSAGVSLNSTLDLMFTEKHILRMQHFVKRTPGKPAFLARTEQEAAFTLGEPVAVAPQEESIASPFLASHAPRTPQRPSVAAFRKPMSSLTKRPWRSSVRPSQQPSKRHKRSTSGLYLSLPSYHTPRPQKALVASPDPPRASDTAQQILESIERMGTPLVSARRSRTTEAEPTPYLHGIAHFASSSRRHRRRPSALPPRSSLANRRAPVAPREELSFTEESFRMSGTEPPVRSRVVKKKRKKNTEERFEVSATPTFEEEKKEEKEVPAAWDFSAPTVASSNVQLPTPPKEGGMCDVCGNSLEDMDHSWCKKEETKKEERVPLTSAADGAKLPAFGLAEPTVGFGATSGSVPSFAFGETAAVSAFGGETGGFTFGAAPKEKREEEEEKNEDEEEKPKEMFMPSFATTGASGDASAFAASSAAQEEEKPADTFAPKEEEEKPKETALPSFSFATTGVTFGDSGGDLGFTFGAVSEEKKEEKKEEKEEKPAGGFTIDLTAAAPPPPPSPKPAKEGGTCDVCGNSLEDMDHSWCKKEEKKEEEKPAADTTLPVFSFGSADQKEAAAFPSFTVTVDNTTATKTTEKTPAPFDAFTMPTAGAAFTIGASTASKPAPAFAFGATPASQDMGEQPTTSATLEPSTSLALGAQPGSAFGDGALPFGNPTVPQPAAAAAAPAVAATMAPLGSASVFTSNPAALPFGNAGASGTGNMSLMTSGGTSFNAPATQPPSTAFNMSGPFSATPQQPQAAAPFGASQFQSPAQPVQQGQSAFGVSGPFGVTPQAAAQPQAGAQPQASAFGAAQGLMFQQNQTQQQQPTVGFGTPGTGAGAGVFAGVQNTSAFGGATAPFGAGGAGGPFGATTPAATGGVGGGGMFSAGKPQAGRRKFRGKRRHVR